jgi:hypothetical protein
MAAKRVADVSSDYSDGGEHPASNARLGRIRKQAQPLPVGKLERDVDALLRSKGVRLDEPVREKRLGRAKGRTQG